MIPVVAHIMTQFNRKFNTESVSSELQSLRRGKYIGQADGRFRLEHSGNHYPYLIGTVKNRHCGPLSPSGSDVPAQQLSRYAGAAAWPARGRPDDNLQAAGQPNSRVSARRCIEGPAWIR